MRACAESGVLLTHNLSSRSIGVSPGGGVLVQKTALGSLGTTFVKCQRSILKGQNI